jgi:hypothetical protein
MAMARAYPERWIELAEARAVCSRAILDQAAASPRRVVRPLGAPVTQLLQRLAGLLRRRRYVGGPIDAVE